MTHPTQRPLLSLLPPFLALSSALPPVIPSFLRALPLSRTPGADGSPAESMARFLSTRTMDVDDVGEAICVGIESEMRGVVGVEEMRQMARGLGGA